MAADGASPGDVRVFGVDGLERLLEVLRARGYTVIGPTARDGAIVYDEIRSTGDLPRGFTDEQEAGRYRLRRRDDDALFGYAVGPHSWKSRFLPSRVTLWRARREGRSFQVESPEPTPPKLALLGVRACEIAAIAVQDRVLVRGEFVDPDYAARREGTFVIAVQCGTAGGTCFCVSMGTGPKAERGFDLALTEILEGGRHDFVVEVGSEIGAEVLGDVADRAADEDDRRCAAEVVAATARSMGRALDTEGIRDLLIGNPEHPRWDDVASRCLACTNCTMVCPTCFCTTVEDTTDLAGAESVRTRLWDSCYTLDFSHLHGGSVRSSVRGRYRQWLTHKLASWFDQFGSSGCVGCGRCITWCPVGIDLTEEVAAIRRPVERTEGS